MENRSRRCLKGRNNDAVSDLLDLSVVSFFCHLPAFMPTFMSGFLDIGEVSKSRFACWRKIWAAFGLLLFVSTWRLWTPQTVYPQVPLLGWVGRLPPWVEWLGFVLILGSLAVALLTRRRFPYRLAMLTFVAAVMGMTLMDQHRLQPWAYQHAIFALVIGNCRPRLGFTLMRLVVVSIYFYSALSKFDYQFLHTLGQQFLSTLMGFVGVATDEWPAKIQLCVSAIFPLGELLIACGLCWSPTRRAAVVAAVMLHVMLLLILGPIGLQHKAGVLIWNLYFIIQAVALFAFPRVPQVAVPATGHPRLLLRETVIRCIVWVTVLLPIAEFWGRFDHWPAWGLYSPRNSRVSFYVHRVAADRLPEAVRTYLADAPPDQPWLQLQMDRWSLSELAVPIYPQDRFHVGVALAVTKRYDLDRSIRVVWQSASHRISGARATQTSNGLGQLQLRAEQFHFNALPRSNLRMSKR